MNPNCYLSVPSRIIDPHTMPGTSTNTDDQITSHCLKRPALRATAREFMPAETYHPPNANFSAALPSPVVAWLLEQTCHQSPPQLPRMRHGWKRNTRRVNKGRWSIQPSPKRSDQFFPDQDGLLCDISCPVLQPADPFHEQIESITSQLTIMRTCDESSVDQGPPVSRPLSGTAQR
jgi:hypothetical protein